MCLSAQRKETVNASPFQKEHQLTHAYYSYLKNRLFLTWNRLLSIIIIQYNIPVETRRTN